MRISWNETNLKKAQKILSKYSRFEYQKALDKISLTFGVDDVSHDRLRSAFLRNGLESPIEYCAQSINPNSKKQTLSSEIQSLVDIIKGKRKGPTLFSDLCDKLDLSPTKTKNLLAKAKEAGVYVHVEHDHVGLITPEESDETNDLGIPAVVGGRQKVGVISDTHLGSKYCLRAQIRDFIHYAYDQGVREILHPGDCLDGAYRHSTFEVSHVGLDEQVRDLYETLPRLPGLTYHGITGNHDFTFTEHSGVDVGKFIENYFASRGRNDFKFYGNRGAHILIRGAHVELWHPKSGMGYAKSYGLQKKIEKYSPGEKGQILLVGHWHTFCYIYERGVHAIACPTFQGGGSAFGKSLGGSPAIGGLILSWDMTEHKTIRNFSIEKRSYFEKEMPVNARVHDRDGIPII